MKFEIKHRFTKRVLFSLETDSFKLCVEAAVKSGANLSGANLYRANLDDKSALRGLRPILQIGPLGSRCAYLVAYLTDKGIRIRAGCFFGGRAEFEKAVIETHGDGIYAKEYHAALAMIDAHAELWMPNEGGE